MCRSAKRFFGREAGAGDSHIVAGARDLDGAQVVTMGSSWMNNSKLIGGLFVGPHGEAEAIVKRSKEPHLLLEVAGQIEDDHFVGEAGGGGRR